MTLRGRKPKPFLMKLHEGNRGKRKLLPGVEPQSRPFEPPFQLDGFALQEWDRILGVAYWLRESDSVAIADRCLCLQRCLEAEEDIRQRGHVVLTRNGRVQNPSIRIARSYRISIQRHDAELGLTASSRGRIVTAVGLPSSGGWDDVLERKLCGDSHL